jgi:hypothetical protein
MVWISGFGFVGLLIQCRRMLSGNESAIHAISVERVSNRQSPARSVVIEISGRAI